MSRDGSGVYSLPAGNPVVDGTTIESTWANSTLADIVVQLNNVITGDGVLGPTAPIKFQSGSAAFPGITFSGALTSGFYKTASLVGISYSGALKLSVGTSGASVVGDLDVSTDLTVDGNVGIGTSTPVAKLAISDAGVNGFEVDPVTGIGGGTNLQSYNRSGAAYTPLTTLSSTFSVRTGAAPVARLLIDSAGIVSLPTTSAAYNSAPTTAYGAALQADSANVVHIDAYNPAGDSALSFGTNTGGGAVSTCLYIDASKQVGIGSISVANKKLAIRSNGATPATNALYVTDSAGAEMFFVRDDGGFYTGSLAAGKASSPYNLTTGTGTNLAVLSDGFFYRSTSSIKYKREVQDLSKGLAAVLALRPVSFKSKSLADKNFVFGGLIAEEVHAAGLTEFVQYTPEGEPDGISYGQMVVVAFKAIQEQQALIQDLLTRVGKLEKK